MIARTYTFAFIAAFTIAAMFPARSIAAAPIALTNLHETRMHSGVLAGAPDRFTFTLNAQQPVFFGLFIPDDEKSRKDIIVEITSERGARYAMDGAYFLKWERQTIQRAPYLKGPEIIPTLYPGTYTVMVSNIDNHGTYALAVGGDRAFIGEVPALTIQDTVSSRVIIVALVIIAALAVYIYRRLRRARNA